MNHRISLSVVAIIAFALMACNCGGAGRQSMPKPKPQEENPLIAHIPVAKQIEIDEAHRQAVRAAAADPREIQIQKQLDTLAPDIAKNNKEAIVASRSLSAESENIAKSYIQKMVLVPFNVTYDEANACVIAVAKTQR